MAIHSLAELARSGVYAIVNKANGRFYIGSSREMKRRWDVHRYQLRLGKHHSVYLQRSWEKHGERAFEFRQILVCAERDLLMYEQILLDGMKPHYNIAQIAGSTVGRKTTEETKRKLSSAISGIKRSDETRALMSASRRARITEPEVSQETRLRQSASRKGRKMPPRSKTHASRLSASKLKISDSQIREMKTLLANGVRQSVVAAQFACSASLVCKIASGKKYSEIS